MKHSAASAPPFAISSGTFYNTPVFDQIEACQQVGVEGLGVWEQQLGSPDDDEEVIDRLAAAGLRATFCFPRVPGVIYGDLLFADPRDRVERLKLLESGIRRLARFDPVAIVILAGPVRDVPRETARKWVVEGLRTAAHVAGEFGAPLALEVIKPGPSGSLASTIPEALDILEGIGVDGIGLLIDTWHFWEDPNAMSDIRDNIDRIVGVQVNDAPAHCRGWCDRALPGNGVMPLPSILADLVSFGFDGWYELEVLSDDGTFGSDYPDSLWRVAPAELAREGRTAFSNMWGQATHRRVD